MATRTTGSSRALILWSEHILTLSSQPERILTLSSRLERSGNGRGICGSATRQCNDRSSHGCGPCRFLRSRLRGSARMATRFPRSRSLAFFSKLCHQRPDRALYLLGEPTAVCVRCLGIYAGAAFGGLLPLKRSTALRWLAAAFMLNIVDVTAESIGLHGNLPLLRLLIGAALGASAGALLAGSLECEVGACETRF